MGHGLTRVAVLGQGSIGRRHAGLLRDLGHEVATYDPADAAGAPSAAEALAGARAAVVATPSARHAEDALLALEAGCDTLVEKPFAMDAAEAARLVEAADGRLLAAAMNLRFHPGPSTVRRLVAEGAVGRVLRVAAWCGSWLPGWRDVDYRETYSAHAALGGGVLLDAIHEVDELAWVAGPATSVSALLPRVSSLELDVEDVALLQLELASGAVATVTLDYLDRDYHRGIRVVGEEGSVAWEWREDAVVLARPGGSERFDAPRDFAPTYRAELEAFLGGTPPATAAEAAHVLAVVDAARRSAREGRRVAV